jgi:hypothetical protein
MVKYNHTPSTRLQNVFLWETLMGKTKLEGEVSLLSFLWYGNNASVKEKSLSMESHETSGLLGLYRTLTPYFILSNFPLPFIFLCYGTK